MTAVISSSVAVKVAPDATVIVSPESPTVIAVPDLNERLILTSLIIYIAVSGILFDETKGSSAKATNIVCSISSKLLLICFNFKTIR